MAPNPREGERRFARSKEHDGVASRIATPRQRREACASSNREPGTKRWDQSNNRPIVPSIGDEQDDRPNSEISLFCADSPFEGLDVVDPGFGFDHRENAESIDDGVGASPVAFDWHRNFGSPAETRR